MRQLARLEELKRLREFFPEPSGSYSNREEQSEYQAQFMKWAGEVRIALITSVERLHTFNNISNAYVNGGFTKPAERDTYRKQMLSVVEQEIHDLEDAEPHWTVTPTFWVALVGTLAAIAAAILAFLAWQYPKEPAPDASSKSKQSSGISTPNPAPVPSSTTIPSTLPLPIPKPFPSPLIDNPVRMPSSPEPLAPLH